ncbi:hypothetical protein NA57DRAFT_54526 [Rhizodiscina lignyota]|uniref:Uncharacterized protein n=1 Tax=Rhizodiscina lignyota TaxID=1504668 RepID=A0A9P4MAJ7_9PEZI|nr:hypothetical protein NA57DRAFT_54526 [Rhizodiscina lignyota]
MAQNTATNVITYVGVPLAVLGVLPTLSTTIKSIITARAIQHSLFANGVHDALTRSSLLSGIIEIEVPRKSITPLERNEKGYWDMNEHRSSLRGGSWTTFYWKEMVIGVKSYRVQYHDELVQPQAEIGFEALIAFLLDRGAVPNVSGFADLRSSGLWTPAGTKLLLSPCTSDAVLMVARSDDSDGILSLSLAWEESWDKRWDERLPPYWVRVRPSRSRKRKRTSGAQDGKSSGDVAGKVKEIKDKEENEASESTSVVSEPCPSPVRLRIVATGVDQAYHEDFQKSPVHLHHFRHPTSDHASMSPTCLWFNAAITALGAPLGGLWSFIIPNHISTFSHRESIPCGVLVLLGLLSDAEAPSWRSPTDENEEEELFDKHQRFVKSAREMTKELRMPPEQAREARMARMQEEAERMQRDRLKAQLKQERRAENEMRDALASPRIGVQIVGEAARKWLIKSEEMDEEYGATFRDVVEATLYDMVKEQELAHTVAEMLERWRNWTENGGMTKSNFEDVKKELKIFCLAACMLALIRETNTHPAGSVVSDLQECLRMWRKVRLG